ncbi:hypothetical protein GLOTRDRAFT_49961 [Gloeophyllum trabeum ATCC 11539]|uniref:F-box domain-containing protein n=1 Tax=Gloeophyllum trabeum (strain ATCC 11539 / FP-39264 / Madison 617) TaxID=670483 RepID=S7PU12_GLOTA|nr:uncharacterized protein GLOTRDRAFT_49961 [Gloeophyllum trabeum ATCC 11539]EPQ50827.1 hypothetical protein GLOTRDRAFT_49961 [Gloeophyllum trabeum ATCC 11539]
MQLSSFADIPIELLPIVFQFIVKPSHLATLCLVNSTFRDLAVSQLYESVHIYPWHNEAKTRVVQLFTTLRDNADLARYVQKLGEFTPRHYCVLIKDFPKALSTDKLETTWSTCTHGLKNCVNLRHCTWTRDGSLDNAIFEALLHCHKLKELEINGHHDGQYDPEVLCRFTRLNKITLIMPSWLVIAQLPRWIRETGPALQYLSIICKASPLVTDSLLEILAPNLPHLEHLSLLGCPKVTHSGILAVLSANRGTMRGLGLEGLSPNLDVAKFASSHQALSTLSGLSSLTMTVQRPLNTWTENVLNLLREVPLELFQVYSPGGEDVSVLPDDFCFSLVSTHGPRLKRFSVHRMRVTLNAVDNICSRCPKLEQLFIVMRRSEMQLLAPVLAKARKLRSVHVNFPLDAGTGVNLLQIQADVQSILSECSGSSVMQFGCNTRVEREVVRGGNGELRVENRLARYESPEVPEQFLVLRA